MKKINVTKSDPVVLITGGTGGIGKAIAEQLAETGAQIIITGRNAERGQAVAWAIRKETENPKVTFRQADMASLTAVRALGAHITTEYKQLDVLINNVGGIFPERTLTEDGLEANFAVNHLAPFLLTQLLVPHLKKSGEGRIINLSSGAHKFGAIDFENLQFERNYRGMDAYASSKLMNLLSVYKQAELLQGTKVVINAADPGPTSTALSKTVSQNKKMFPPVLRALFPVFKLFGNFGKTEKAAVPAVYLATAPETGRWSGKYLEAKPKLAISSKLSYDKELQDEVWRVSEEILGLRRGVAVSA